MKMKNGFTLVELLAVIVILAVILAIAIPSISGILNGVTKSSFESDAKMVLNAVKYKKMEDENFDYSTITVGNMQTTLGIDGSQYKQVSFEKVGEDFKIVIVGNKKWNGLTASGTFKDMDVVNSDEYDSGNDTIDPVITLIGNSSIDISKNSTYTDAGATATDNTDGDITSDITVTSNLNTSIAGSYTIEYNVSDNAGNAATPVIRAVNVIENFTGPSYIASKGVNGPILATGMTPIKWNGTAWIDTNASDSDWYNYTTTDKKWANARTADGSMWVWIPRYVYRISSGWHTSTAGTIDIQFSKGTDDNWNNAVIGNIDAGSTSNASNNKYTNHPAFTFGAAETAGIWVAKFEASGTTTAVNFVPNVSSLRSQSINTFFTSSRNMETNTMYGWGTTGNDIDTHMMKNSEWGTVAYLAWSTYGKNAEIWINNANDCTTGCAANSVSQALSTTGCLNTYDTTNGLQASTTGNIYGIYDMSGGTMEYTASYVDNGHTNLNNGSTILSADNKYKDVYTMGITDTNDDNYALTINSKGDALYETTSWKGDFANMPMTDRPWFARGGSGANGYEAGVFDFYRYNGSVSSAFSFRAVVLVKTGL